MIEDLLESVKKPYTRLEAYIDLAFGKEETLSLAKRWGWPIEKVRRFQSRISTETSTKTSTRTSTLEQLKKQILKDLDDYMNKYTSGYSDTYSGGYTRKRQKRQDKLVKNDPPTLDEITAYKQEKNLIVDAEWFHRWHSENDWRDRSGRPVKNWKLKMLEWNRNECRTQGANRNNSTGVQTEDDWDRQLKAKLDRDKLQRQKENSCGHG